MAVPLPVPPSIAASPRLLRLNAFRRLVQAVVLGALSVLLVVIHGPIVAISLAAAIALFELGLGIVIFRASVRLQTEHGHSMTNKERSMTENNWWYNHKTGEVEEGPVSLGSDRDGPYATREDAARAPEIAAERSRQWAAEDATDD